MRETSDIQISTLKKARILLWFLKELEGKLDFQGVPILKIRYVYLLKTSLEHLNNKHFC